MALVLKDESATYFNIPKGPYFKMGIYVERIIKLVKASETNKSNYLR